MTGHELGLALAAGLQPGPVIAIVLVLLALAALLVQGRRRRPRLEIHQLDDSDGRRYLDDFATLAGELADRPDQSVARARGMVEEVLRRMGFPDRIDTAQKARDLAGYDRQAASALATADRELRGSTGGADGARRALEAYGEVLRRLLGAEPG